MRVGNEEDGTVIGYQRNGEEWICLYPLRDRGQKPFVATQWRGGRGAWRCKAKTYWVGFRAWDDYIARLKTF
jgi:hypothetical protein